MLFVYLSFSKFLYFVLGGRKKNKKKKEKEKRGGKLKKNNKKKNNKKKKKKKKRSNGHHTCFARMRSMVRIPAGQIFRKKIISEKFCSKVSRKFPGPKNAQAHLLAGGKTVNVGWPTNPQVVVIGSPRPIDLVAVSTYAHNHFQESWKGEASN